MKKIFLKSMSITMSFVLLFSQTIMMASPRVVLDVPVSVDLAAFELNVVELNSAMQDLNELEVYLDQNQNVTFDDLEKSGSVLAVDLDSNSVPAGNNGPLGIPSFLWGCVFGAVGILLVYLISEKDMDETKKALWGCVASTAVVAVIYLVAGAATAY